MCGAKYAVHQGRTTREIPSSERKRAARTKERGFSPSRSSVESRSSKGASAGGGAARDGPAARASITVEIAREEQFTPIKNADGADSPASCRRDMNRLYARWLDAAGVSVARGPDGEPVDLEIDPRLALDAGEARERLGGHAPIVAPTALGYR